MPAPIPDTIPAPVAGWDASSALANMKPDRAIWLENFFPQAEYVEIRRGSDEHATVKIGGNPAGPVETVMAYHGQTNTGDKLLAVAGGTIFDVTSPGAGVASSISGLATDRLQYLSMAVSGGTYLCWCNGSDPPQAFDGTVWAAQVFTDAAAPFDGSIFINIGLHKGRIWYVEKNSLSAWYLAADAFQGDVSEFPMTGEFTRGGYLVAVAPWTIDAGEGMDDHLAFISSEGEIAIYTGTDPASNFVKIGTFYVGPPIGYRCLTKVGGDVAIISIDGVLPLSRALITDRAAAERITLTRRIQRAMNDAAQNYKDNFGWQIIGYPKGTRAILNVPVTENGEQWQFVMNTLSGAWCIFTKWDANCWEIFQDRIFYGDNIGAVIEADTGGNDQGEPVQAHMRTAFNYFGARGVLKRATMIRPLLTSDGSITPSIKINADFNNDDPDVLPNELVEGTPLWGSVTWGSFVWGGAEITLNEWQSIEAIGQGLSVNMIVQWESDTGVNPLKVNAFDLTLERGGFF